VPNDTPDGVLVLHEDWLTQNIATSAASGVRWLVSSDTGNTAFIETGSALGVTAKGTTDTTDNDMCEIGHGLLAWSAQHGYMAMEVRLQADVVTTLALTVGFNDDALDDSNTLPVELSGTTFTSNAGTFVGFVFDTDATNDFWHCFMVDDDADTTVPIADLNTGVAPVAGEYQTLRVEVYDQGSGKQTRAVFYINGKKYYEMASAVDRDALLTPHVAFENHGAAAHVVDIEYITVWMSRPAK